MVKAADGVCDRGDGGGGIFLWSRRQPLIWDPFVGEQVVNNLFHGLDPAGQAGLGSSFLLFWRAARLRFELLALGRFPSERL